MAGEHANITNASAAAAAAAAAWQLNLIFIAAKKVSRPAGNGGA